jgi:hypothetical protein
VSRAAVAWKVSPCVVNAAAVGIVAELLIVCNLRPALRISIPCPSFLFLFLLFTFGGTRHCRIGEVDVRKSCQKKENGKRGKRRTERNRGSIPIVPLFL